MSTPKPRVLVIGGKRKNIPAWAEVAFEIELLDQDGPKSHINGDRRPASAIVIYTGAVSRQHSSQAHDLGSSWDVPVLKARDGWCTAVEQAAKIGAAWFVDAVQAGSAAISTKNPPRSEEGLEIVDNAWRTVAEEEVVKRKALERRLRKVQGKLDKVGEALARVRSGAEERIVAEIRRRAAEVRAERAEIQRERADLRSIARRLGNSMTNWVAEGEEMLGAVEETERGLQDEVDSDPA